MCRPFQDKDVRKGHFTSTLNKLLVRALTAAAQGKRVHLVDMYPAVAMADLPDGIHPNSTGHSKMATTWYGEMIRSGIDQTLEISPCNLRYLYQGMNPSAGGDYNRLPWRLGLLTQTNSSC